MRLAGDEEAGVRAAAVHGLALALPAVAPLAPLLHTAYATAAHPHAPLLARAFGPIFHHTYREPVPVGGCVTFSLTRTHTHTHTLAQGA